MTEKGKVKPSHLDKTIEYTSTNIVSLEFDDDGLKILSIKVSFSSLPLHIITRNSCAYYYANEEFLQKSNKNL